MKKVNYFDRVIITEDGSWLACDSEIEKYVEGDYLRYSEPQCVRIEDGYATPYFSDELDEYDFEDIYEEDAAGEYEFEGLYDDEVKRYRKLDFDDCWRGNDRHLRFVSQHGINTSEYDITDAEIVEAEVFKADNYIPQDYPYQCCTTFYKAVAVDGRIFFFSRTSPFFVDEQDDTFDEISEEEFNLYE